MSTCQRLLALLVLLAPGCLGLCPPGLYPSRISTGKVASAVDARFRRPEGLLSTADGKTVYIADRHNHLIRKVDVASNRITTVTGHAGRGFRNGDIYQAQFKHPSDLTLLSPTQLVVADYLNNMIRLIDLRSDLVETLAGMQVPGFDDGLAVEATFHRPSSVAALPDGSGVVVADAVNYRIRIIWLDGWSAGFDGPYVTTLAGGGPRTIPHKGDLDGIGSDAAFAYPRGLAVTPDGSTVVVADSENHKIRLVSVATGAVVTLSGSGTKGFADGSAMASQFRWPFSVDVTPNGEAVVVADTDNQRLRLVSLKTGHTTTLVGVSAGITASRGVAVMPDGRSMFVSDTKTSTIYRVSAEHCLACNNSIPAHAVYSTFALNSECRWECERGRYESHGECKLCSAGMPLLSSGSCPTGHRVYREQECPSRHVNAARPCIECPWRPCSRVGTFRANCSHEDPDGPCLPCTRKPPNSSFVGAGATSADDDDCPWQCNPGFYQVNGDAEPVGSAVEGLGLSCAPCRNKPQYAVFSSDSPAPCSWTCLPGFQIVNTRTACWPSVSFVATIEATGGLQYQHLEDLVAAICALTGVSRSQVHVGTVGSPVPAFKEGQIQSLDHLHIDGSQHRIQTTITVSPEQMQAVHSHLTLPAISTALHDLTVGDFELQQLSSVFQRNLLEEEGASHASDSAEAMPHAAIVAGVITAVVCGALLGGYLAVRVLRLRRKASWDSQLVGARGESDSEAGRHGSGDTAQKPNNRPCGTPSGEGTGETEGRAVESSGKVGLLQAADSDGDLSFDRIGMEDATLREGEDFRKV